MFRKLRLLKKKETKKRNFFFSWKRDWSASLLFMLWSTHYYWAMIIERCLSHRNRATWGTKQQKAVIGGDVETCAHADSVPISGQAYYNPSTCQGCRGSAGLIPFCSLCNVASGTGKLSSWMVLSAGEWEGEEGELKVVVRPNGDR